MVLWVDILTSNIAEAMISGVDTLQDQLFMHTIFQ